MRDSRPVLAKALVVVSVLMITGVVGATCVQNGPRPAENAPSHVVARRLVVVLPAGPRPVKGPWTNSVNSTIDLLTGGILPGNEDPADPSSPFAAAYDPNNGLLYVASDGSSGVAIVNASTGTLVNTVSFNAGCCSGVAVMVDSKDHRVFFAEANLDVGVLDDQNNTRIDDINIGGPFGSYLGGFVLDNQTDTLYVTDQETNAVTIIDAANDTIVGNLSVCSKPTGGSFDPTVSKIFFQCWNGGIGVVNASSNTFLGNISNPSSSEASAYDPANGLIYVANTGSGGNCTEVNPVTDTVIGWTFSGNGIVDLVYDATNGQMITSDKGSGIVQAFQVSAGSTVYHKLGGTLGGMAIDPTTGVLFVTSSSGNNVTSLSLSNFRILKTIRLASNPWGMVYVPTDSTLYVANSGMDEVQAIDPNRGGETNLTVGSNPMGLAYDNATGELYVVNSGSNNVSAIALNPFRVTGNFPVGSTPEDIAYDPANHLLYVTNPDSNNVTVLNGTTGAQSASIAVGSHPWDVVYDPANGLLYVSNDYSASVSVIKASSNSVSTTIQFATASGPLDIAVDPSRNIVAVTQEFATPYIWFINGSSNTVTGTNSQVDDPYGIAYDPLVQQYLVTQEEWNNASIVNASSGALLGSVSLGNVPKEVIFAPGIDEMFVADRQSAAISILNASPTTYGVGFNLSGPASHGNWSVDLDNRTMATNGSAVSFREPNGTYQFTSDAPSGFVIVPSSGNVTVNGSNSTRILHLERTYRVTFNETGLPSQTNWTVKVNGTSFSTSNTTLTLIDPNGSYHYQVVGVPGWSTPKFSGTVSVSGQAVRVLVNWTRVAYSVDFSERGLPKGTNWSVTIGSNSSNSSTHFLNFSLPNGTYSWSISPIAGYKTIWEGQLTVKNDSLSVSVNFTLFSYGVAFLETGLPSGTNWSVSVGSRVESTVLETLNFTEPNGTYDWSVQPIPGYLTNWTGRVVIQGMGQTVHLDFAQVVYPLTFEETGLPVGTSWTVRVAGVPSTSSNATIVVSEPNGTYAWQIEGVPGYTTNWTGTIAVDGYPSIWSVVFAQTTYPVTINESGLPSATPWTVTVGGETENSTANQIVIREPNGSYAYSIAGVPGWTTSAYRGTILVASGPYFENLVWAPFLYDVAFIEMGLPSGTNWTVQFDGITNESTAGQVTFLVPNGTSYPYAVSEILGYVANPADGSISVNGEVVEQPIQFSSTGLPSLRIWANETNGFVGAISCVNLTGRTVTTPPWEVVQFTAIASGGVGPYAISWSLSSGGLDAVGPVISHNFTGQGNWTVLVTVKDSAGRSNTSMTEISLALPSTPPPTCPTNHSSSSSPGTPVWTTLGIALGAVVGAFVGVVVLWRR